MATYRLRVIDKSEDGGVVKLLCADDDLSIWSSDAAGATSDGTGSTMEGSQITRFEVMDIPLLSDGDNSPGIYIAACSLTGSSWRGCAIYRSADEGTTFERMGLISQQSVLGHTSTRLADWGGGNQVDVINTVDVSVKGGTLSTVTLLQMLNGANLCLIGDELVRFRKAELLSAGNYRLSGLLRGRKGTEKFQSEHIAIERFVLLDDTVSRFPETLGDRGKLIVYRAVSIGDPVTAGFVRGVPVLRINSLQPLAPVHLKAVRIGENYYFSWIRRTRLSAQWIDGGDAPLGESSERYLVRVVGGADWSAEVTTNACAAYTHDTATGREVQVAQIGDHGPGWTASVTLP